MIWSDLDEVHRDIIFAVHIELGNLPTVIKIALIG